MRTFLLALIAGVVLAASPARADERSDLIHDIGIASLAGQQVEIDRGVQTIMKSMAADEAGLTVEEHAKLEKGVEVMLRDVVIEVLRMALSDTARFPTEDLRQIKAFLQTPAGAKWSAVAQNLDEKDPHLVQMALVSLFKNIDPGVMAKLTMAASAKKKPVATP